MKKRLLVIDVSNSFTKVGLALGKRIIGVRRYPTKEICGKRLLADWPEAVWNEGVLSSVVPHVTRKLLAQLPDRILVVDAWNCGGLVVDYPEPKLIGADRLANALACVRLYGPGSVVVDFGTAVTFDVINSSGAYVGGVIAPGLGMVAESLHSRTALLPKVHFKKPRSVVGRTTKDAMNAGAVFGYGGLVKEILGRIREEEFGGGVMRVVATGGDARLVGSISPVFDRIDPLLTLRGLAFAGYYLKESGGGESEGMCATDSKKLSRGGRIEK